MNILPAVQTTWVEWINEHPKTKVLKKDEQVRSSHYEKYFLDADRIGIFGSHHLINRLPAKALVHGISIHPFSLAVSDEVLKEGDFYTVQLGPHSILLARGSDNGVRAFEANIGDKKVTFRKGSSTDELLDSETSSTWDIKTGESTLDQNREKKLKQMQVTTAFWFAWSTFYHNTELFSPPHKIEINQK